MPRDRVPDSSLALWRQGYLFLSNRRHKHQSAIFATRILGRPTICLHGPDAVELIYDPMLFERQNALPQRVLKTLMGRSGVQTLDDDAHQVRKQMFMRLMTPEHIDELVRKVVTSWESAVLDWQQVQEIVLFPEVQKVLCRAACVWAGVPLSEADVDSRADDLAATIDGFGGVGRRYWRGKLARQRLEAWLAGIVTDVRAGQFTPPPGSPLEVFATDIDADGERLDLQTAAVEILNVIRPIVAIATPVAFATLALHEHPEWRDRLRSGDSDAMQHFVHEVRRYYPFTPAVGAVVRDDFDWRGHHFSRGALVLVDVYGLHHDPTAWSDPQAFQPDRFKGREIGSFDFIPQGGGDFEGHRCAGEWITIAVLKAAVQLLVRDMEYTVPEQDLTVDLNRIPTWPRSGVVINVKAANQVPAGSPEPQRASDGSTTMNVMFRRVSHAAEKLTGRLKVLVGKARHNRRLEAKGRLRQAKGDLKHAGEQLRATLRRP